MLPLKSGPGEILTASIFKAKVTTQDIENTLEHIAIIQNTISIMALVIFSV
jgi:hypothetical protein